MAGNPTCLIWGCTRCFRQRLRQSVLAEADQLAERCKALDYFQPIDRFVWGSNSDVLNAAMLMANAYRLDPKPEYLGAIQ